MTLAVVFAVNKFSVNFILEFIVELRYVSLLYLLKVLRYVAVEYWWFEWYGTYTGSHNCYLRAVSYTTNNFCNKIVVQFINCFVCYRPIFLSLQGTASHLWRMACPYGQRLYLVVIRSRVYYQNFINREQLRTRSLIWTELKIVKKWIRRSVLVTCKHPGPVQGWNCRGGVEPPSSSLQTLIFEWKSAINFNPLAKF